MALQITHTNNVYVLHGRLCSDQVHEVRNFFKIKLKQYEYLMIDLGGLDDLDLSAGIMLQDLKKEAYRTNRSFRLTTSGNKKIMGPFQVLDSQLLNAA
ncbi:hypothetical protein J1N09_02020 [Aureitalea sp. L0-47]|uniref:hypothetical protein n=1 Tax=Aureitalea sp. L0-47 TaxID=2816962 RepID=UPI0022385BAE|nr:hypothetical protein [Aureitalea sp. L0-47]MCW5518599.1 hypothetical protein [Aureitalea sp. L0-47]